MVGEPAVPARNVVAEALGAHAPIHDYGNRARDVQAVYDTFAERLINLTPGSR